MGDRVLLRNILRKSLKTFLSKKLLGHKNSKLNGSIPRLFRFKFIQIMVTRGRVGTQWVRVLYFFMKRYPKKNVRIFWKSSAKNKTEILLKHRLRRTNFDDDSL